MNIDYVSFFWTALIRVPPSKTMAALGTALKNIVLIITCLLLNEIAKKTRMRLTAFSEKPQSF